MDRIERVQAALEGRPVDRLPFTFWHPFGLQHMGGEALAAAQIAFARRYRVDLLKVEHGYPYPCPEGLSIDRPQDFTRLEVLQGKEGDWEQQLLALRRIGRAVRGKLWYVETVWGPWAVLCRLAGRDLVLRTLREHPGFFRHALQAVGRSLVHYVRHVLEAGAQGIFLVVAGASYDVMTPQEYAREVKPWDCRILEAAKRAPLNAVRLEGRRLHFETVLDYPARILSWSHAHSGPGLERGAERWGRAVLGGLDEAVVAGSTPADLRVHLRETLRTQPESHRIIAPGGTLPADVSPRLLEAIRDGVADPGRARARKGPRR